MPDYSKAELFATMSAHLDEQELRQLCLYLSYNQRLESLRYRKLWHDPASVISDLLDLCERRQCLPMLVTTLQERFPHVLAPAYATSGPYQHPDPFSYTTEWDTPISYPTNAASALLIPNPQLEAARRNLAAQAMLRAERRAPLLNPPATPIERQGNGFLIPTNPLHWLLLLWWFIAKPHHLKEYRAGMNAEGELRLRRTAVWTVSSLAFLPMAGAWLWLGLSADSGSTLGAYWPLTFVSLVGLWLGISLFAPVDRISPPTNGWAGWADPLAMTMGVLLSGATALLLTLAWWRNIPLLTICLIMSVVAGLLVRGVTKSLEVPLAGGYITSPLIWLSALLLVGISVGAALGFVLALNWPELNFLMLLVPAAAVAACFIAATILPKLSQRWGERLATRYWQA